MPSREAPDEDMHICMPLIQWSSGKHSIDINYSQRIKVTAHRYEHQYDNLAYHIAYLNDALWLR